MNDDFTHRKDSIRGTLNQLQQVRSIVLSLNDHTQNHMREFKVKIEQCGIQAGQLIADPTQPTVNNKEKALEIAKIKDFDLWLSVEPPTTDQITAQQLFERVTTKISHMFKSLQTELIKTNFEKDDLQKELDQQEECDSIN